MPWPFSSKPAPAEPPAPTLSEATASLANSTESIAKRIAACDETIRAWKSKGSPASGKVAALAALRRRKQLESQQERLFAIQDTVEGVQIAVESAEATRAAVDSMRAMKGIVFPKIEMVEEIVEEMEDFLEEQQDIQDLLGNVAGRSLGVDEDDLMRELEGLEEVVEMEKLGNGVTAGRVPASVKAPELAATGATQTI